MSRMSDFEKQIHSMFDHIWDCDINHPVFEDTVGDLMEAVIQCYRNLTSAAVMQKEEKTDDTISRQAAIKSITGHKGVVDKSVAKRILMQLPSAQPEQTDCEYCHEDSEGYVRPIEKNSHAWLVRRGRTMKLRIGFKGEYRECDILFCPMCGRRLTDG